MGTVSLTMTTNMERYLVRKYGAAMAKDMILEDKLSDIDRKVILSMDRLQKSYAKCQDKKVQTVLIEYQRQPMFNQDLLQEVPKKAMKVINTTECRAFKMNGDKCTAKTKCGDFCARHTKK